MPHQNRWKKNARALIVVRSRDEIRLQHVVGGSVLVLGPGGCRQALKSAKDGSLRLPEQELAETVEINPASLWIEFAAGVKTPAHAPGRALALISAELRHCLAQIVQTLERFDRRQIETRGFAGGNTARGFQSPRFQAAVANPRDQESGCEDQAKYACGGQQDTPGETGFGA